MYLNARNKMVELASLLHTEAENIHAQSLNEENNLVILDLQEKCASALDMIEGVLACIAILDKEFI